MFENLPMFLYHFLCHLFLSVATDKYMIKLHIMNYLGHGTKWTISLGEDNHWFTFNRIINPLLDWFTISWWSHFYSWKWDYINLAFELILLNDMKNKTLNTIIDLCIKIPWGLKIFEKKYSLVAVLKLSCCIGKLGFCTMEIPVNLYDEILIVIRRRKWWLRFITKNDKFAIISYKW